MARNQDPFAPWNSPGGSTDPTAPWNDMRYRSDPFALWNSPFASAADVRKYADRNHIERRESEDWYRKDW